MKYLCPDCNGLHTKYNGLPIVIYDSLQQQVDDLDDCTSKKGKYAY